MGVRPTTLTNYRQGKTLPDARVIGLICDLTGDDPARIAVEIEEKRATTPEARALWHRVAERLAAAGSAAIFAVAFLMPALLGFPPGAQASTPAPALFTSYTSWNVARRITRLFRRSAPLVLAYVRALFSGGNHVQSAAPVAAA
jgi:hypothetical protein